MLQTFNSNNLREQIIYEVNNSNPEILELFYNYIEVLKKSLQKENKDEHRLSKFAGILTQQEGQEMIDCINNEFNNIEGE